MLVCLRLSDTHIHKVLLFILIQLIKSLIFHRYLLIALDPVAEIDKLHGDSIFLGH